jgi:hypothetical protein
MHGYELVAPLDAGSHLDTGLWRQFRNECHVRRFWDTEEQKGYLAHKPGGVEHAHWSFDYGGMTSHDDGEEGYRFGAHAFRPGEYVSIGDAAGEMHTFRVTSVEPVS